MMAYGSMMSQVLQCTQFEAFKWIRKPLGVSGASTISYTLAGQKFMHGLPYSRTQRWLQMSVS
jgi:hypothetical protein